MALFGRWVMLLGAVLVFTAAPGPLLGQVLTAPAVLQDSWGAYPSAGRRYQSISSIETAGASRLWASWMAGDVEEGPDNYVVLARSEDGGQTWSLPLAVIDPPGAVRAYDPCLWRDPLGRLWWFFSQSSGWFDGYAGLWYTRCDNPNASRLEWTKPERIANGVMVNKPTVMSTGEWVWTIGLWSHVGSLRPNVENASNVYVSRDLGATFQYTGSARYPNRSFDENMMVERTSGEWVMYTRLAENGIGMSVSTDRGKSWSNVGLAPGVDNPDVRFFVRKLSSGRWLLVHHDSPTTRTNLVAKISEDEGRTWKGRLLIDARVGISYPDGFEGPAGEITITYDYNRYTDKEIWMAKFTEADVLASVRGQSGTVARSLIDRAGTPRITSATTTATEGGQAWSYQIIGNNAPTRFTATALPVGLVLDTASGSITGTPTSRGNYSFTVTASSSLGTAVDTVKLFVAKSSQAVAHDLPLRAEVGQRIAPNLVATSGLPVGLSVVSGPALIDKGALLIVGEGPVVCQLVQAGDAIWAPSPIVTHTVQAELVRIPPASAARLVNLSARAFAGAAEQTLIVGLVVRGATTKELLLRGMGPSLAGFGIARPAADPALRVFAQQTGIGGNDDWGGAAELEAKFGAVGAFLPAGASRDAALESRLAAGAYTIHLEVGASPGIALAEIYDLERAEAQAVLANLSARAMVRPDEESLIAGFVVAGPGSRTLLIRGLGPALASFGIGATLGNPLLKLYHRRGALNALLAVNDDWGGDEDLRAVFPRVGAAAWQDGSSRDAALLVTLPAGEYTVQLSGADGGSGVGLIEIFLLD